MLVSGVDEAGRGPVIGPLVIAGVSIDENDLPKLVNLGVKDSKLLSPQRRTKLATQIRELAHNCHIIHVSPHQIDRVVERGKRLHKLNRLEARAMARVITVLMPDVAYVDAADTIADRFREHIAENLTFNPKIICEHKADINYPIVSAASIIAKVERDKAIAKLQKKHGNIGCGYPNDHNTIKFLQIWIRKFGAYPDFVRKSWKTAKRVKNETDPKQKKLR
jgi:ribonuclease HII